MANCVCQIAANFPELANLGIISATLKTNQTAIVTEDGIVLEGPTLGDLSITAYSPLPTNPDGTPLSLECPGKAGVSYEWEQRIDCDTDTGVLKVYFIPRGKDKSYIEGDVPSQQITMTYTTTYETFSASASSGPTTPILRMTHRDGYNFSYTGTPISVGPDNGKDVTVVNFLTSLLPTGSKLYLVNFSWEHNQPNIPNTSYSFLFSFA